MAKLVHVLAAATLIDSTAFAKATVTEKTATLAAADNSKPIIFVESFSVLGNKQRLKKRLLEGEDVSVELEYNGIEISREESEAFRIISGVVERIVGSLKVDYPFSEEITPNSGRYRNLELGDTHIRSAGYNIAIDKAQKIWDKISPYWAKYHNEVTASRMAGAKQPRFRGPTEEHMHFEGQGGRYVYYRTHGVEIGCQTVDRYYFEQAALHYGWSFPA